MKIYHNTVSFLGAGSNEKTYLYKAILSSIREEGGTALVVPTEITVNLLAEHIILRLNYTHP